MPVALPKGTNPVNSASRAGGVVVGLLVLVAGLLFIYMGRTGKPRRWWDDDGSWRGGGNVRNRRQASRAGYLLAAVGLLCVAVVIFQ
jgi:hypothetical protein